MSGQQQGSHRMAQGSSASALVSTLIPVFIIATAIFVAFLILRKKFQRVYQPRTYLTSLRNWQKSPRQTAGLLGWRKEYSELKDEFILGHASLDNYLWLRFFKILATMCFVGCLITWPILFPVNATGHNNNAVGLDVLSFSHINPGPRYYAQTFVSWIFLGFVMLLITRESRFFVRLRQQYYTSPYEASRISTRTVLLVNVPEEARNEEYMRKEFSLVKTVWLVNVPEDLADKVQERDQAAAKLETGEIKLIQNYIKRKNKEAKKAKKHNSELPRDNEPVVFDKKDTPTHRLPKLKFLPIGKKVQTIDWARNELGRLVPEVATEQNKLRSDRSSANVQQACFLEFESVQAAHTAMQKAGLKNKASMTPKELGPTPENIIWPNIIKPFAKTKTISTICTAFIWFLCIFWTIPVAVIGAISNINYLENKVPFLSFINSIPSVILGVVTGLLPVVLLAVLMALVPIICNILAKLFEPTQSAVQMKVQGWYFPFQVIQVFLITTFASGAASVVSQIINQPTQAPALLAQNLPKASNFYISYFILYGLNAAAMQLLNIVPLLFVLILGKILDKTPRKMFNRYVNLGGLGWGSVYASYTNLGVIALSYSCISPLILAFAAIGFTLLYLGFRYNILFTLGTKVSTRGESFARALKQLTVGIYISEICLIGLFAIGIASSSQSIGPLVLMIIFLAATIGWHVWLGRHLKKLNDEVPESSLPHNLNHPINDEEKMAGAEYNGAASHNDGYADKSFDNPKTARGGMMQRIKAWFSPDAAAHSVIQSISPRLGSPVRPYTQREHDEAYIHPAIISECPQAWIARDKYGISKTEIHNTQQKVGEGFEMTDEGAWFNDKGKVEWNENEPEKAPIYEDEPAY